MSDKEAVRYFYERVVSEHLLDEVAAYIAEDCVLRIGEQTVLLGLEGMKQHLIDVKKTYPDYTMRIIRQYHDGDYVISEFIMEGTHQGEWLGMKPTNKRLTITGVDVDKVQNGKIVEHGGAANTFEALFQAHIIQPA
ncbi:MAG: ester cyclase [Clostridia bacterium]|nr:ester cyclase [Clostridia bacterium]